MHKFRVGDTSHPELQQIVEMNEELHENMRDAGTFEADVSKRQKSSCCASTLSGLHWCIDCCCVRKGSR